jgi:hypothetical protein
MPRNRKNRKAKAKINAKLVVKQPQKVSFGSSRVKRKRVRNRRGRKGTGTASMRVHEMVCAVTDPFCPAALGSKWPDGNNNRTLSVPAHGRAVLSCDVNGNACILILPGYTYQYATATVAGSTPTYAVLGSFAAVVTGAQQYRIVSWGVRMRSLATPMTASGMVRIRVANILSGQNIVANPIDTVGYNVEDSWDQSLASTDDVTYVGRRTSELSPFNDVTMANFNNTVSGWFMIPGTGPAVLSPYLPVQISVTGGPASTSALDLEFYFHYEVTFNATSQLEQLLTKPIPANTGITDMAARVMDQLPSAIVDSSKTASYQAGKSMLGSVVTQVMSENAMSATSAAMSLMGI